MNTRAERRRKQKLLALDKNGNAIKNVFRWDGIFKNPQRRAKKALRLQYHCTGKRLVALQKRFRRAFKTELVA